MIRAIFADRRRKKKGKKIVMPGTSEHSKTTVPKEKAKTESLRVPKFTATAPIQNPDINSFCVEADSVATKLELEAFNWVFFDLMSILYSDSIVPIVPSTNPVRMCHQTPQALRIFYSKKARPTTTPPIKVQRRVKFKPYKAKDFKTKNLSRQDRVKNTKKTFGEDITQTEKHVNERLYSYGLLSILSTTGFHPSRDMKVRPFSRRLESIVVSLEEEIKKHLPADSKYHTTNLNFNSLEVKVYHGKDVFRGSDGRPLVDDDGNRIRVDCNKKVNLHNDLCFNDEGKQSPNDTARGDHPIVTLTIGSSRALTFVHKWKADKKKWKNGRKVHFQLGQGSMFVLLPEDEIPQAIGTNLHKTQHRAQFSGDGISVALVFRSVKTSSVFHKENHTWQWQEDEFYRDTVQRYLKKNSQRHIISEPSKGRVVRREVEGMKCNVKSFLDKVRKEVWRKTELLG